MGNEQMLVTMTVGQLRQLIREEVSKEVGKVQGKGDPSQPVDNEMMTMDGLASYLNCSRQTIHNHIKSGKLPKPYRVGRRALWDKALIDRFLNDQ